MLGKAAFWLGVTVLLTPHEPDIGLGRPSTASFPGPSSLPATDWLGRLALGDVSLLAELQAHIIRRVPEMRAEIEESQKRRQAGYQQ